MPCTRLMMVLCSFSTIKPAKSMQYTQPACHLRARAPRPLGARSITPGRLRGLRSAAGGSDREARPQQPPP
eukprot:6189283-Pleurochrysis_carterae.AAC.1